jgi:hypothetical protein
MVSQTSFNFEWNRFYLLFGRGSGSSIFLTNNCISLLLNYPYAMYVHPGIKKHYKLNSGGKIS